MAGVAVGTDPIQDVIAAALLVIAFLGYRNGRKIKEVHGLVNQQLTDSEGRRDAADERERATNVENERLRADAGQPYDQGPA